jgi:hypothetical protein
MTISEQIAELADEIQRVPGARVEFMPFPSGAASLDVWWNNRFFVMQYFPSYNRFGVDEVQEEEEGGPFEPFHFGCGDFATAKQHLMELLAQAGFRPMNAIAHEPHR